jgi:hypothetical protein
MDARSLPMPTAATDDAHRAHHHRRHVIALILAAAIAGLVFAAYRQPDFVLGFGAFGLC